MTTIDDLRELERIEGGRFQICFEVKKCWNGPFGIRICVSVRKCIP